VTVTAPSAPAAPPTPLFKDFAETWYLEKEVEWRKSHRITVRRELDSLISRFGEKAVGQITKADVLAYRAELGKVTARGKETKLSAARINKMLNPLRQILNEAADRFNFPTPCQNIKQLRIKRTDVDPFSLEDVRSILATVREDFRDYFTVRFFTGMRTGEVDGLKWKYVDFERRLILVRETVVLGDEEYTKTDGSQRDIQMSQLVFEALKRQQATGKVSAFVFCNRLGKPLDHKNVTNRVWYPSSVTWGSRSGGLTSAGTRRHPVAGRRRGAGVDRAAARPHDHRDAVPGLFPLRPQPDPPGWFGLRAPDHPVDCRHPVARESRRGEPPCLMPAKLCFQ
jgi:integrase